MRFLVAALFACSLSAAAAQTLSPWELEPSETTADLRGVHAVGGGVVWASGTGGTVLRSQDSGFEWQSCATPPGADKLDFRAIWAWDDQTAVVMSSGTGALSRIYKTTDGCAHWTLLFTNPDKDGFWDAMVFPTRTKGYLLGDPVDGMFTLFTTENGGVTWSRSATGAPKADTRATGVFAASNSSLVTELNRPFLFGTTGAYVYMLQEVMNNTSYVPSNFVGPKPPTLQVWGQYPVPMARSNHSSGIFSLGYRRGNHFDQDQITVAIGGDYTKPDIRAGTAAWTSDQQHWTAAATPPGGYRSAVAWDAGLKLWVAVGPNGSDISRDDGKTWQPLEHAPADAPKGGEWNALSLPWAVGPHGRIGKLNPEALPSASKRY